MQSGNVSPERLLSRFLDAGVDNVLQRIWDSFWIIVVALVLAVIGYGYRYYSGRRDARTMIGVGATVALISVIVAVAISAVVTPPFGAIGSALVMLSLFAGLWLMGKSDGPPKNKGPLDDPQRLELSYDPDAPKKFTARTVDELFDLGWKATPRQKKAELEPQKGLWIEVEGEATSIVDDAGSDGNGGTWAACHINYAKTGSRGPIQLPRIVLVTLHGSDADILRSMKEKTPIKAVGRIHNMDFSLGGGILLAPCELREYGGKQVER